MKKTIIARIILIAFGIIVLIIAYVFFEGVDVLIHKNIIRSSFSVFICLLVQIVLLAIGMISVALGFFFKLLTK